MIVKLKDDIALVIKHIAAVNFHPRTTKKNESDQDIVTNAAISVIVSGQIITVDYETEGIAKAIYYAIIKSIGGQDEVKHEE